MAFGGGRRCCRLLPDQAVSETAGAAFGGKVTMSSISTSSSRPTGCAYRFDDPRARLVRVDAVPSLIPARAGIQRRLLGTCDLGPRFRGIKRMLHQTVVSARILAVNRGPGGLGQPAPCQQ